MLSFSEFIKEHVMTIMQNDVADREKYKKSIHDILKLSYAGIGGYRGLADDPVAESTSIYNDIDECLIKAITRGGRVTAVGLYRLDHGRKIIAVGTDGTPQGKSDFMMMAKEDHALERAWGEVSGGVAHVMRKIGHPALPNTEVSSLLGKDVIPHADGESYTRSIGGKEYAKVVLGHPKKS